MISHSAAETESFGEQWGRAAQAGWVIGLSGDLGAGKTQFVKGLARGLGAVDRVHSPTFALLNEYASGRLPLFHLDLYRLDTREQIVGAGLEPYFYQPPGVTVVEWAERWFGKAPGCGTQDSCLPALSRFVRIETLGETDRRITYEDFVA
jgi:tRNA threonylcarbamoyladenosine biosynthesis protein TsaE